VRTHSGQKQALETLNDAMLDFKWRGFTIPVDIDTPLMAHYPMWNSRWIVFWHEGYQDDLIVMTNEGCPYIRRHCRPQGVEMLPRWGQKSIARMSIKPLRIVSASFSFSSIEKRFI
jgi:hypothetical protein